MSNKELRPLASLIFTGGTALHGLASEAARRSDLAGFLRAALPAELAPHLLGGNLRSNGVLVVLADSPAWAARLRFESAQLLARCRELHPESQRVKVRVAGPGGEFPA
jgi:hypothetical protein